VKYYAVVKKSNYKDCIVIQNNTPGSNEKSRDETIFSIIS
jgi:hypothetical protein